MPSIPYITRSNTIDTWLTTTNNIIDSIDATNAAFDESVDDRVATLLSQGNLITLTYDDANDDLSIGVDGSALDTLIYDNVGGMISSLSPLLTVNYDGINSLTLDFDNASLDEQVDDRVATLIVAGTGISTVYDDVANTLTINTTPTGNDAATLNGQSGSYYLDRTNHTGTQLSTTISDFSEAVDDRVSALVVAGTNITVTYDDVLNTLTFDAIVTSGNADTLENQSGSYYLDRTNHTGTQAASTINDFSEAVDDRVGALLFGGTGINLNYDDVNNVLVISSTAGSPSFYEEGGFVVTSSDVNFVGSLVTVTDNASVATITIVEPTGAQVSYDNATSGLTATDVQAAIDELDSTIDGLSFTASSISYDNATSGLTATDVQAAIDEVEGRVDTLEASPTGPSISDEGSQILATPTDINFVGDAVAVTDDGDGTATVTITGGAPNSTYTIANNTATATDITGLLFDGSTYRGAIVDYSIYRSTDTNELSAVGELRLVYKPTAGTWTLVDEFAGDNTGVTLSILNTGQIQYTSTDVTGTSYAGNIKVSIRKQFEL